MDKYYVETKNTRTKTLPQVNIDHGLIEFLGAIIAILSCTTAKKIYKISLCTACLIAFIGVIGAIELGALSLVWGAVLGIALAGIEVAVMRSLNRKHDEGNS